MFTPSQATRTQNDRYSKNEDWIQSYTSSKIPSINRKRSLNNKDLL